MLKIEEKSKFRKDYKQAKRRGLDMQKLKTVQNILASGQQLPEQYLDHKLTNCREYMNCRECHIAPDWLLVYRIDNNQLILECIRTGTHSELFGQQEIVFM